MAELAKEILQVNLEDEMRQSYLDYAMSVIVGRALPEASALAAQRGLGEWDEAHPSPSAEEQKERDELELRLDLLEKLGRGYDHEPHE